MERVSPLSLSLEALAIRAAVATPAPPDAESVPPAEPAAELEGVLTDRATLVRQALVRVKCASPRAAAWWCGLIGEGTHYPAGTAAAFESGCQELLTPVATPPDPPGSLDLLVLPQVRFLPDTFDWVRGLGHALVVDSLHALLAHPHLPHTILYVGGDTYGIGWWTRGRGIIDASTRVLRVAVHPSYR